MTLLQLVSVVSLLIFTHGGHALSWSTTPLNPAAIPLAVRTPYLSCWLPQGAGTALNGAWPTFWTGSILGWAGFVNVDGVSYTFLGAPSVPGATFQQAAQKSFQYTATQSIFVMSAGPVDLTVTFLSPVEPTNLTLQSLPLSYLAVSAAATDGKSHTVEVYTDISAEWVTGNNSQTANWTTSTGDIITHQVQLENQQVYTEVSDHIQQGSAFYSTLNTVGATYQTGQDIVVRAQFIKNGQLNGSEDTNFRAVDNDWPVFALAHNLGTVTTATAPVIYSVGHIRDPAVEYIIANNGMQARSLYFWSSYSTPAAAISFFLGDYSNALSRAKTFDSKISNDASKISSQYVSLAMLSVRQALGAMEITISQSGNGAWNTDDVLMFLKEISSDGNVNTVDVIFPTWPILLYTNPTLGKYLLLGLFQYQATGQYPNRWSVHDLGSSYPKAVGHNAGNDEAMPLEECGNMLIMTLSYTQATGDHSLISQYSGLLDQWTQYLIAEALIPANQISTDDFAGSLANQTNLAIKGITGIAAMSQVWSLLGNSAESSNYSSIATSYVTQFEKFATSSSGQHLTLAYGQDTSWGLAYNLLGDKLLKLNLFPASIYNMQTAWYKTVANKYGVPLDTRHTYTKSDWQIWTSAIVTDTATRDLLVNAVTSYASDGANNAPLSDFYDSNTGDVNGFRARPVVGGHLALLVVSNVTTTAPSAPAASASSKSDYLRFTVNIPIMCLGILLSWVLVSP